MDVTSEAAGALVYGSRVATEHGELAKALGDGSITFDRMVATARLAAAGASPELLAGSAGFDLTGVRRLVAAQRRFTRRGEAEAFRGRYVAMQPTLDETAWRLWGQLPGYEGRVVERALIERADALPQPPAGERASLGQRSADALVAMAQDSIDTVGHGVRRCRPCRRDERRSRGRVGSRPQGGSGRVGANPLRGRSTGRCCSRRCTGGGLRCDPDDPACYSSLRVVARWRLCGGWLPQPERHSRSRPLAIAGCSELVGRIREVTGGTESKPRWVGPRYGFQGIPLSTTKWSMTASRASSKPRPERSPIGIPRSWTYTRNPSGCWRM